MKGIIYTRISSDEQVKGTSLEFQEDPCKKYCQEKGIEIVSIFREEVDDLHVPMISKEEMYQIMMIRAGKAKLMKRNRYNPSFPLRRTILCAACSRPITGSAPRGGSGGRYFYYHCQNKNCSMFGKAMAREGPKL